jgi:alpha-N-arabinofuranosidase
VVTGDLLVALLNHADRVRVGCLSLLANVSAPILTRPGGPARKQTIFYPFALAARMARGLSLRTVVDGPEVATVRHGDVPAVAAAATHDEDTGDVALFVTNRGAEPARVRLRHAGPGTLKVQDAWLLTATGSGLPVPFTQHMPADDGTTVLHLPAESWTALKAQQKN